MEYFLTLFTWFLLGGLLNNLSGCENEGANTAAGASPQHLQEVCESNEACRTAALGPWQRLQAIADEFYLPGEFTTFKAYEYTRNLQGVPNDENF